VAQRSSSEIPIKGDAKKKKVIALDNITINKSCQDIAKQKKRLDERTGQSQTPKF